ncbi:ankyrin repeat [Trichoderma cornu-damae]|uniref:Ankyrin repeat n=1 Tax=Trichoderma cornu-damae TaxID=654480 RepID=A0A9P8TV01_9HYPO|nr:ankyrin repeat [Trichoderma cornu-damae]
MAAASRKIEVAKKLLEHNANPNALGKGFIYYSQLPLDYETLEGEMANNELAVASRYTHWRPLFIPFVLGHQEMIELLLANGASPVLAVMRDGEGGSAFEPGSINVLHILASQQMRGYTDAANQSYFNRYSSYINNPILRGEAPLFIALRHCNEGMLRDIIANGGDVESVSELGRTPLIQAIIYCYKARTSLIRMRYRSIIVYLARYCGAVVGSHPNAMVAETPLTAAIMAIPTDWKVTIRDIRLMVDLLLECGAGLNEVSNSGHTILHALCRFICSKQHGSVLIDLFKDLVRQGADLQIPLPSGHSMLGACIVRYNRQPLSFYRLLLQLGASLVPQEVSAVFERWAECPNFRKSPDFDVFQYREHITQAAIDYAYKAAFDGDEKLLSLLQRHFTTTNVAERAATEALLHDKNHSKRFNLALKYANFNGLYIHDNGNNLLHSVIDRLETHPRYKDAQATADTKALLSRGVSLECPDDWGRTPLQRLWCMREKIACASLRLYLHDVRLGREYIKAQRESQHDNQDELGQLLDDDDGTFQLTM